MSADPDLARLASLITEPARATILAHLLDGRSWTAAELATIAGVGPSTASVHLRKLLEGKLIHMSPSGRHRYFRLAGPDIARMLEHFARFAPPAMAHTPGARRASLTLRRCRLCYDHLAGEVAVAITESMLLQSWLTEAEPFYQLTPDGSTALANLGIEIASGRTCMDWSERRLHLAGPLGRHLASSFLDRDWLRRDSKSRALWVTPLGTESLQQIFRVRLRNG